MESKNRADVVSLGRICGDFAEEADFVVDAVAGEGGTVVEAFKDVVACGIVEESDVATSSRIGVVLAEVFRSVAEVGAGKYSEISVPCVGFVARGVVKSGNVLATG